MMLKIKRVSTVVFNYQKDEAEEGSRLASGCGRNCLRSCCLLGVKLPLYAFKKVNNVDSEKGSSGCENKEPIVDFFNSLLLGEWEDRLQRGLFPTDVIACETKVIPGNCGFIAQLNEGRHLKKRPTEFRVDKVLHPFDENKFNFTKVGQEEVLFQFEPSDVNSVQFFPSAPVDTENSPSVVAISVRGMVQSGQLLNLSFNCLSGMVHSGQGYSRFSGVFAGNPELCLENSMGECKGYMETGLSSCCCCE